MRGKRRQVSYEGGFSLLETVTAILILSLVFAVTVPIWSVIQSQERLAAKIIRASELAVNEMERAYAGIVRTGSWAVTEAGEQYKILAQSTWDTAGSHIRVNVSFHERGKDHAVSYESVVP